MKHAVTLACWATAMAYCALSIVAGPSGLMASRAAAEASAAMERNLRQLESKHADLALELNELRSSVEAVALESRSLGYVAEGETMVVFQSLPASRDGAPEPGSVVAPEVEAPLSDASIKLIAACVALAAFSILYLSKLASRASAREPQRESLVHEASRT